MINKVPLVLLPLILANSIQAADYALAGSATGDASISLKADTDNTGEDDNAWIYFSQDGGASAYVGFVGYAGNSPDSTTLYNYTIDNSFLVGTKTGYPLQFGTNGMTRLTIDADGLVGIGVSNPQARLHLGQAVILGENISDSASGVSIRAVKARGTTSNQLCPNRDDYMLSLSAGGYNESTLYSYNKAMINLRASENWTSTANGTYMTFETTPDGSVTRQRAMRIDQSGNVGIGTDTPTHRLSVNGPIRAKEIIVDTGWSDYVFEPSYRLASLAEVEKHILVEGHLPDVPSAKEVDANGISLGASQAILLRKIEELTLHLINHEKAIELLKNENAELRQELQQARVGG